MKASGASYEEHEAIASGTGRRCRKGVVYKAIHGLSPTFAMGVIWRHDDPGADLSSFLRVARESFKDKGVISSRLHGHQKTSSGQEEPVNRSKRRPFWRAWVSLCIVHSGIRLVK